MQRDFIVRSSTVGCPNIWYSAKSRVRVVTDKFSWVMAINVCFQNDGPPPSWILPEVKFDVTGSCGCKLTFTFYMSICTHFVVLCFLFALTSEKVNTERAYSCQVSNGIRPLFFCDIVTDPLAFRSNWVYHYIYFRFYVAGLDLASSRLVLRHQQWRWMPMKQRYKLHRCDVSWILAFDSGKMTIRNINNGISTFLRWRTKPEIVVPLELQLIAPKF